MRSLANRAAHMLWILPLTVLLCVFMSIGYVSAFVWSWTAVGFSLGLKAAQEMCDFVLSMRSTDQ